ncbi:MAG: TIGR03663 family protein, partial [Chloroflexota bacterium]|nr:TIGR03663 family protein [Chloroflexota bacterium]
LLIIALTTRFWDLGARGMSHDGSLHALYSWKLYRGEGYSHDPMMHGPFLYHINALVYFLFGVSDYTARMSVALFGTILVATPYLLRKWLGRAGAITTSLMLLISPVLLHYSRHLRHDIFACVWTMLMIIALFKFVDERKDRWLYMGTAALTLSLCTKETSYIFGFIGLSFLVTAYIWERVRPAQARALSRLGGLAVVILLGIAGLLQATGNVGPLPHTILVAGFIAAVLVVGRLRGTGRPLTEALSGISSRALLNCVIIAAIIFSLLFTTFFTNPKGLITAVFGSVSYWLAQHGVQRGGQPWYYYILLLLPLYEFLPSLFALGGLAYYLVRRPPSAVRGQCSDSGLRTEDCGLPMPLSGVFLSFLAYWTILALLLYSWAGEKMPWLTTHLVLPLALLAGSFVGGVIERADWRGIKERGGWLVALLLLPALVALVTLFRIRPFQGMSLSDLNRTGQWLAALVMAGLLVYILSLYIQRLGRRRSLQVVLVTTFAFLSLFTVRYAWLASYINYDYAKEFIFYAHGTPDIKRVMGEIAELSRRTVGDKQIKVAYDDDSTWPLEWYLKDYTNRAYYGKEPTRQALDAPVVIVGSKNESKVRPFLGNRYHRFERRLIWWPIEDYKGVTLKRLWGILRDPAQREKWWNIILYREYDQSTAEWEPSHRFYLYVRKDVANKLWDYHVGPVKAAPLEEEPYEEVRRPLSAIRTWGTQGSGPGQFQDPRGIAIGPEGRVYVADGGNHRVQAFDGEGKFLREWGAQGGGPGQFQEPWGLAVAPDGEVYVADTWNHRVQVFDAQGNFAREWGTFAQTAEVGGAEGQFWGPRDIAIDTQGDVYVTDTGNKRVQKFSPEGEFLGQWGGDGIERGEMDEPVGIAISGMGYIYVADTWNQRVQKFNSQFAPLAQWSVEAWFGQSVVNKPYIATDPQGRIYITDPEGYQVIAFTEDGELVATFGQYGSDTQSFALPIGIDIDRKGCIYVVDSGNNRVMKFGPLGKGK